MAYAANYRDFGSCFRDKASAKCSPDENKPGMLRRIFGAVFETRLNEIGSCMICICDSLKALLVRGMLVRFKCGMHRA
jgi:hypothetical protein